MLILGVFGPGLAALVATSHTASRKWAKAIWFLAWAFWVGYFVAVEPAAHP